MLLRFCTYGFLKNLRFFEPFLYLFFLDKGLSYTEIGILIGTRELCTNLFEIPTGIFADVVGRRMSMVISFSSYIISFLIFYLTGSFWLFFAAIILYSAGDSFRSGTHKSMILQHLDLTGKSDEKVSYYGTTRAASRFGSAVSALLAAGLAYMWSSYDTLFLATLVPYTGALLLMFTYPSSLDGEPSGASIKSMWAHTKESFRELYRGAELRRILVNASIFDAFFRTTKDYLSPIVKTMAISLPLFAIVDSDKKQTALLVGFVYFFVYLNSAISSKYSAHFARKYGSEERGLNFLFYIFAISFLTVGICYQLQVIWLSVLAFFCFFTLYNLRKPSVVGYIDDHTGPQRRATLLSTHTQGRSLAGALTAPALGLLADHWGVGLMFVSGGLVLLLTGLLLPVRRPNRSSSNGGTDADK